MVKNDEFIPSSCSICRNKKWSEMLISGEKSVRDAMITFHMTEPEVVAHIQGHPNMTYGEMYEGKAEVKTSKESRALARPKLTLKKMPKLDANSSPEEVTTFYYDFINNIRDWLEIIMENDPYLEDRGNMDMLLKITDRIFKGLEQATKVQGITDTATTKITNNYVEVQGNINFLQNLLIEETCPNCRPRIIKKLEEYQEIQ